MMFLMIRYINVTDSDVPRALGGLGDFIISRLQSYIPFLMKMLKMSTFGELVLIDNWNNIIYFFLDICWQVLFNGWLLFKKI